MYVAGVGDPGWVQEVRRKKDRPQQDRLQCDALVTPATPAMTNRSSFAGISQGGMTQQSHCDLGGRHNTIWVETNTE